MLIREKTAGNKSVLCVYYDEKLQLLGTFEKMEDGYYWLFLDPPRNSYLCFTEWVLEQLAKELHKVNAEWDAIVTKEFSKPNNLAAESKHVS